MTAEPQALASSRAIVIGVSAYEYAGFPPIRAARNSWHAMRELLADPLLCGWPPGRITVISNPISVADLAVQIADLAEETTGVLLLYYVGHGVLSPRGELCLTVSSTRPDRPEISSLLWADLAKILRDCPARTRMVILDCCFAGQAVEALTAHGDAGLTDITHVKGVYTLTATASRSVTAHVPSPDLQDTACTSFTSELCDLVRSGIPGKPEQLTVSDIYKELRQRLKAKGLPMPNQSGTDTVLSYPFTVNAAVRSNSNARMMRALHQMDGAPEGTNSDSRRTSLAKGAPNVSVDDEILLLMHPGEAKAIRADVRKYKLASTHGTMKVTSAAADLEEMGAKRAAMRLNRLSAETSAHIVNEMHSGSAALTLRATEGSHAAQILLLMNVLKAAAILERLDPEDSVTILRDLVAILTPPPTSFRKPGPYGYGMRRAAQIMNEMRPGSAATILLKIRRTLAARILLCMDRVKAAAILERVGFEDVAAILTMMQPLQPFEAQDVMARMTDDKLAKTISILDPTVYAAIRTAEHPKGNFNRVRSKQLLPWKRATYLSAFGLTSTTAALYWAVIFPHSLAWSLLVWLAGLIAFGLGIFISSTDTQKQSLLVISTAGFWLSTVCIVLTVTHFLSAFFVLGAVVAMIVSIVAVFSGGFTSVGEQARRQTRPLPDLPQSDP